MIGTTIVPVCFLHMCECERVQVDESIFIFIYIMVIVIVEGQSLATFVDLRLNLRQVSSSEEINV